MKYFLISFFIVVSCSTFAQQQDAKQLYETAKGFMRQGDYDNATLVFNRALQQDPLNLEMLKDFTFLNVLKRDFSKAIEVGKTLVDRPDADEQTFQILGMAYKAVADNKECGKLYKKALKKFPTSGVLLNDAGELSAMDGDMTGAINSWEHGIESDPNYSSNYYNATMYYARAGDLFWILIYGELFLNIESYSTRSAEMKSVLLEAYKKLYAAGDVTKLLATEKNANAFEKAFIETLAKSNNLSSEGITPENLGAIRTRFILDWFGDKSNEKFPFRLFDNMQYLLREGIFDAYNQWIFGAAKSPSAYQTWISSHEQEANAFKQFQQSRIFKVPSGQHYREFAYNK
jgi:lipopolysaccharide biosynthesis regulator YciM